jgi:hypothetical protein
MSSAEGKLRVGPIDAQDSGAISKLTGANAGQAGRDRFHTVGK